MEPWAQGKASLGSLCWGTGHSQDVKNAMFQSKLQPGLQWHSLIPIDPSFLSSVESSYFESRKHDTKVQTVRTEHDHQRVILENDPEDNDNERERRAGLTRSCRTSWRHSIGRWRFENIWGSARTPGCCHLESQKAFSQAVLTFLLSLLQCASTHPTPTAPMFQWQHGFSFGPPLFPSPEHSGYSCHWPTPWEDQALSLWLAQGRARDPSLSNESQPWDFCLNYRERGTCFLPG